MFLQTRIIIRYRKIVPNNPQSNNLTNNKNGGPFIQNNVSINKSNTKSVLNDSNQQSRYSGRNMNQFKKPTTKKQKTIRQVLQLVSKWRSLYQQIDYSQSHIYPNGRRIHTLQTAAQKIGIQKKTLDDYYYKIKSALGYGFDLQKNMHQKIGKLRKFVKECIKAKRNNLKQESNLYESNQSSHTKTQYSSNFHHNYKFNLKLYPFLSFLVPKVAPNAIKNDQDDIDFIIGQYISDQIVGSSSSSPSSSDNQDEIQRKQKKKEKKNYK